jgi:hypothetical protein
MRVHDHRGTFQQFTNDDDAAAAAFYITYIESLCLNYFNMKEVSNRYLAFLRGVAIA